MTTLSPLSLNTDWQCDYFELEPALYEFATSAALTTLSDWSFDSRRAEGWAAWLQRRFTLDATDFCVRYLLLVDSAPAGARIYINGQEVAAYTVGDDDPPFELDVTDAVWLGENRIAFRVECDAAGRFAGVRLQPVSCE